MPPIRAITKEIRATLALAVPTTAGQVGQMLLGFCDSLMVGRLGVTPLAASAFALGVFNVLFISGIGLTAGVGILAARAHGAADGRGAGEALRHGLAVSAVASLGAVGLLLACFPLLDRLGAPPAVLLAARPFLRLLGWSMLPALAWQCLKTYCEALSRPALPMAAMLGGVALNLFLNWVLIYGKLGAPALGLAGSGWATLVSRWALLLATFALVRRSPALRAARPARWLAPLTLARLRALLALGLPVALQLLLEVGAFSAAAVMMGWLGAASLAAHQVAISYAALTFMFPLGVASAVSVRVAQAVGAGERARVRAIGVGGVGVALALMSLFALGYLLAAPALAGFFIPDGATAAVAAQLLLVAGVFQIFDGVQVVALHALRGLSDLRVPTALAFVSYWLVALPAGYGLGIAKHWGGVGLWWGLASGLAFASATLLGRFLLHTRSGRVKVRAVASPFPDPMPGRA